MPDAPAIDAPVAKPTSTEVPPEIRERLSRAETQIRADALSRQECLAFWRGDQYISRSKEGYLVAQGTVTGSKPNHRPRTKRNLIHGLVESKISAATQRTPAYEVNPSSTDPEDINAAHLAGKIATFGYEKWGIRKATKKVVAAALVMDGGYAMPYWDSTIGPYIEGNIGVGDIRIRTFTGNEVGWEPGADFQDSPYHVIRQARPVEEVKGMIGFVKTGEDILPDAASYEVLGSGPTRRGEGKLVMVTEYLERPCAKYPKGRRLVIANDRLILPEETYPGVEEVKPGQPVPLALHQLAYTIDPEPGQDRGMVVHMLDAQRTYNNCTNQQIAWAQLALNPQIIGPPMANKIKFTDEPGAYYPVIPVNGMVPQWRDVPPIPAELSQMKEEAKMDMQLIAASDDIPPNLSSAQALQTAIDQSRSRWETFLIDVAAFHAELMRHCLQLVQRHYSEKRVASIRGRFGWESIRDFKGSDLRDQVDVTVLASSIVPRTRDSIEKRVQWLVQAFPGFVRPEVAMAALEGGTGEKLIESYELDVSRANLMLQKVLAGPDVLFAQPMADPSQPPPWAPRKFDNVGVHKQVFEDYMKTPDFDQQKPDIQEALRLYWEGCDYLEQQAAAQQAQMQAAMAENAGMANASSPQAAKPMPSLPTPGQ